MEPETRKLGDPEVLGDHPDWKYLLREFYLSYRFGSAGGSKRIRTHMRTVREEISRALAANPPVDVGEPVLKPVCSHLARAIDNGEDKALGSMVKSLAKISGQLAWHQGYRNLPRHLERRYAYAELLGPRGPVVWPSLILGLVLFAPETVYPAHSHRGITESYICLSGAVSENDAGVYVPGSLILNLDRHEHRITTSSDEPVLLVYAWTGSEADLAGQALTFSRSRRDTLEI